MTSGKSAKYSVSRSQAWSGVNPRAFSLREAATNSQAACQSNTASVVLEMISSALAWRSGSALSQL
jgi:hypothetical protein